MIYSHIVLFVHKWRKNSFWFSTTILYRPHYIRTFWTFFFITETENTNQPFRMYRHSKFCHNCWSSEDVEENKILTLSSSSRSRILFCIRMFSIDFNQISDLHSPGDLNFNCYKNNQITYLYLRRCSEHNVTKLSTQRSVV